MGPLAQQLILHLDLINSIIAECGGIFINYQTCPSDMMVLARVNPNYSDYIITSIQNMGFIVRNVNMSGIQTYIYIGGYMY